MRRMLTVLLMLPLAVWGVLWASPLLVRVASRAALVSAFCNMPEGGLALLEERFRWSLYPPEHTDPEVRPQPQQSLPEESAPETEKEWEEEPPAEDLPGPETVPEEFRGAIKQVQYGADGSPLYIPLSEGYLKNTTKLENEEVEAELEKPLELKLEQTTAPQVLIVHTHATEAYEPYDVDFYDERNTWRSTDNAENMVQVGNRIAEQLQAAGIGVIHDDTQHDYPSYNGAYDRSAETIRGYLDQYPTIKVVLDVHRDAIQPEDEVIVKAVAQVEGKKAAQVMIITGCEDGTMGVPHWSSNLRFAAALQSKAEGLYPGLMRPIFFCYRKYNMDLTRGSILLEFGSHGNTLEQAEYSGELIGKALAQTLLETR